MRSPGRIVVAAVFAACFAAYSLTMTPGVDFIDSGELAAACSTLGIAHPTGYPLFTILGYLFSHLPIAATKIARLNRMSALLGAAGAAIFCLFLKRWLDEVFTGDAGAASTPAVEPPGEATRWVSAGFGASVLGLSRVYWDFSNTLEVYSLQALLVSSILALSLVHLGQTDPRGRGRWGFLFALFAGLGFANHLTTILVAPALLFAFVLRRGMGREAWKEAARLAIPFALGLSLYAYLPLRHATHPPVDWGDHASAGGFLEHVSGAYFRGRMLRPDTEGEGLRDFFARFPARIGYLAVVPLLAGLGALGRAGKRRHLGFILLLFAPALAYASTYDIPDNLSYFLLCYCALAAAAAVGTAWIATRWTRDASRLGWLAAAVLAVAALAPEVAINGRRLDKTGNHFVEDYGLNILENLEPNAILFVLDVQILGHPLTYFQTVEKIRPDVTILTEHLLRKTWTYPQIERRDPALYRRSAREIDAIVEAMKDGGRTDWRLVERLEQDLVASIVKANYDDRPIYMTSEFDPEGNPRLHPGFRRIPEGLVWRLYRAGAPVREFPFRKYRFRELAYPDRDADAVRHGYLYMLNETGVFEASIGDCASALEWIEYAMSFYPRADLLSDSENGRRILPNRLGSVRMTQEKVKQRCAAAGPPSAR